MTEREKVVIELHPYIRDYRSGVGASLWYIDEGRKAAKDHKMTTLGDKHIVLNIPPDARMGEGFLKGLLGPLARKVGPENLEITVNGGCRAHLDVWRHRWIQISAKDQVEEYLIAEGNRIRKRAEKKPRNPRTGIGLSRWGSLCLKSVQASVWKRIGHSGCMRKVVTTV